MTHFKFATCILAYNLAFAAPAHAENPFCVSMPDKCTPLIACNEETGEYFRGGTLGQKDGPVEVRSSDGVICTGTWYQDIIGLGHASVTCSDGRSGSALFTFFEKDSGTAVGNGQMSDGATVRFWSGFNLERYFKEIDASERARMTCSPSQMLLG